MVKKPPLPENAKTLATSRQASTRVPRVAKEYATGADSVPPNVGAQAGKASGCKNGTDQRRTNLPKLLTIGALPNARSTLYRQASSSVQCVCGAPRHPDRDLILDGWINGHLVAVGLCEFHSAAVYGVGRSRPLFRTHRRATAIRLLGRAHLVGRAS